ncbi:hypothetical protein AWH48_12190 [Domibacillus aminovorans]|uniref:Uncharacterized protein n=1 Tax=Domibacillus aminovorans TaxID=29332 RepID=A0A177KIB5_9BACI|nr:hypothetical protein [Domibacillus aminovorans]OAH53109.1 hypothetical protein AWH48_12190 [Domibacillus aminovorans]
MSSSLDNTFVEMTSTRVIVETAEDTILVPLEKFEMKSQGNIPCLTLTLKDIAGQCIGLYGKSILIDVWYELGLNGYIYRYGNYAPEWVEHGKTRGFA